MAGPLIGIADHDSVLIRLLDQVLTEAGFQTIQLPEGSRAYEEIKKTRPDLIVLDTWLESREAGWMLFQALRLDRETRNIPVLICSSDLDEYEKRAAALEEHSQRRCSQQAVRHRQADRAGKPDARGGRRRHAGPRRPHTRLIAMK